MTTNQLFADDPAELSYEHLQKAFWGAVDLLDRAHNGLPHSMAGLTSRAIRYWGELKMHEETVTYGDTAALQCALQRTPIVLDSLAHEGPTAYARDVADQVDSTVRQANQTVKELMAGADSPAQLRGDLITSVQRLGKRFEIICNRLRRAVPVETANAETDGQGPRKTKKHKANAGNRLKADAKREFVLQWLKEERGFDGTYAEMSAALERATGLKVSVSTLCRYLSRTQFQRRTGNPHEAAKKAGKSGTEREAVSREEGPDDMSNEAAWTMPDAEDENESIS